MPNHRSMQAAFAKVQAIPLAAFLLTLPTASLLGKEKNHVPLPAQVITAKTVYIDNQSEDGGVGDKARDELRKWGRFQIVSDRAEADLIFVLSTGEYSSYATSTPPYSTEVEANYTYLTIIDGKSGQHLWNASQKWGNLYGGYHSATRGLVNDLKKRVEEQIAKSPRK
ncbi:MAG: hypothetical protein WCC03_00615 [Candidatus Acidiferrales bacterium]